MLFSECGFYALSARKQLANLTSNLTPSTRIYQTNAITLSTLGMGKHNEHAADPVFIGSLWGDWVFVGEHVTEHTKHRDTGVFPKCFYSLTVHFSKLFQNFSVFSVFSVFPPQKPNKSQTQSGLSSVFTVFPTKNSLHLRPNWFHI